MHLTSIQRGVDQCSAIDSANAIADGMQRMAHGYKHHDIKIAARAHAGAELDLVNWVEAATSCCRSTG
jgi:hypothetical protein